MNDIEVKDRGNIVVSGITLAHLSRGLYRSTATVFKELVNNSYDADAPMVRINTNYPEFDFISCVDNGKGMSLEEFLRYFSEQGGIGSCIKRKGKKDTTDGYNRPIIGRLGIGMLAMGQLCHSFQIESHYKNKEGKGEAYRAEIILEDIFPFPDKEQVLRNEDKETKEMNVGTWGYEKIEYDKAKEGFRIYSSDVRATFRREMKDGIKYISKRKRNKALFNQALLHSEFYDKNKSISDCKPYLETLWELSILCPLPYYNKIGEYPFNLVFFETQNNETEKFKQTTQFIKERQTRFLEYKFRVVFDGIELWRHIQFPTRKGSVPKLYFIKFKEKVFGSTLEFYGYLFAQIPYHISPLELNGIQIRLRGVGIGGYDHTFLKYYRTIPTIRNRWISGEIFVDEGLESALNIDRDSFNEHNEHFKKLQTLLHDKLEVVLNEINNEARNIQETKKGVTNEKLKENRQTMVIKESNGKFKLTHSKLGKNFPIVTVNKEKGEIILNESSHPLKKKKANMILETVELAYFIAENIAETEKERHDIFYRIIKETLDKLV